MPRVHLGMWKISTLMRPSLIQRYIKGRSSGHSTGSGNSHHWCSGNIFALQANVASSNLVWCFKDTSAIVSCIWCPSSVGSTPTHRNRRWSLNGRSAVISVSCFYGEVDQLGRVKWLKIIVVWVRISSSLLFQKGATNPYNRAVTWTKRRLDRV